MAIATGITIEEFERLPDALAHNHELVNGELVDVSGNTPYHNKLRDFLIELLRPYVRNHKLGTIISEQEFDFDGNAYGPDVAFIGADKVRLIDNDRRVQRFVPDRDRIPEWQVRLRDGKSRSLPEVWGLAPKNRWTFVESEDRDVILKDD